MIHYYRIFSSNPIQSHQILQITQGSGPWTYRVRPEWVVDIWTALIVSNQNINPWDDHILSYLAGASTPYAQIKPRVAPKYINYNL